jgi:hypothetical protein
VVLLKADVKPGMSDFDRSNDMHMIGAKRGAAEANEG